MNNVLCNGQDLVLAGFPYQAFVLIKACRRTRTALVYDAHNVEAERFASAGSLLRSVTVRLAESRMVRDAAAVLAVS